MEFLTDSLRFWDVSDVVTRQSFQTWPTSELCLYMHFFLEAFKYIWDSHNALRSSGFSKILLDCARLFEILGILDSRAGSLHVFEPFEFLEILRCGTHTNTVWKMLLHSLGFLIILKNNCNLRYKRITKLALETDSSRLSIDYRWIFSRSYDGTRIIPMMYKCRQ